MRTHAYLTWSLLAGAVLICLVATPASATVLCHNGESTSSCSEPYEAGTEITSSLTSGTKAKLKTEVKTVECSKSMISATTESGGSETETVKAPVETLTLEECNCEVKVLKRGTLEVHSISGTTNGTLTATGAEVTASCSTIFGPVHCIYATEKTDLGTLTGGTPGKSDINALIPRLTTSFLCSAEAIWEGTYEVTSPNHLYVTQVAKTNTVLCQAEPQLVGGVLECPPKYLYSGVVKAEGIPGLTTNFKWNNEEISCTEPDLEGKFAVDGRSAAKGGITKFVFESLGTGACTSTLPNNPEAKVKGINLNFEGSTFTYISSKSYQGSFVIDKNAGTPELQIEIIEANPKNNFVCKYTLLSQANHVQNGSEIEDKISILQLSVAWTLKPKEPGACSSNVNQVGYGNFLTPDNFRLFIAKE